MDLVFFLKGNKKSELYSVKIWGFFSTFFWIVFLYYTSLEYPQDLPKARSPHSLPKNEKGLQSLETLAITNEAMRI